MSRDLIRHDSSPHYSQRQLNALNQLQDHFNIDFGAMQIGSVAEQSDKSVLVELIEPSEIRGIYQIFGAIVTLFRSDVF